MGGKSIQYDNFWIYFHFHETWAETVFKFQLRGCKLQKNKTVLLTQLRICSKKEYQVEGAEKARVLDLHSTLLMISSTGSAK